MLITKARRASARLQRREICVSLHLLFAFVFLDVEVFENDSLCLCRPLVFQPRQVPNVKMRVDHVNILHDAAVFNEFPTAICKCLARANVVYYRRVAERPKYIACLGAIVCSVTRGCSINAR